MRVWLEILKERHPEVSWIPGADTTAEDVHADHDSTTMLDRAAV
jgi:hypothetical protein